MDLSIYAASDDISYMYLLPMKVVLLVESLSRRILVVAALAKQLFFS
jgi:hypothetical protein